MCGKTPRDIVGYAGIQTVIRAPQNIYNPRFAPLPDFAIHGMNYLQ